MTTVKWLLCCLSLVVTGIAAPNASAQEMRMMPAEALTDTGFLILTMPQARGTALMAASRGIEARYGVQTVAEWPLNTIGAHCLILRIPDGVSAQSLVDQMAQDTAIRTAQRMRDFRTLARTTYADNLFKLQHGLRQIRAPQAHRTATGKNVRIAVIDTGIDFTHPDLVGCKASNKDFVGADPKAPPPPEEHGTVITGVIAADGKHSRGIVGVAPEASIIGLRACWQEPGGGGRCNSFSLARALDAALLQNADVINMSLGGPHDPLLAELIETAQKRGVTIVAAKAQTNGVSFPASMPGVVAVGASLSPGDGGIVAPGTDIISTVPKGGYGFFSGASVSAAHASGVAALLLEAKPNLGSDKLRQALGGGADSNAAQPASRNLDACRAIAAVAENKQPACE